MRTLLLLTLFLLSACGRPLTTPEISFLQTLQGDDLNPAKIRVLELGLIGLTSREIPVRPRTTCRELIYPEPPGPTVSARVAGIVGFNWIWVRPDWYVEDYVPQYPQRISLPAAMFLAHEITHVWQWQNRELTGYHPLKVAVEHTPGSDPYLFETDENARFLDFAYEQQSSLVEEYVCCRAVDPQGARTQRLARLLAQVMPLSSAGDIASEVALPWDGVDLSGICA